MTEPVVTVHAYVSTACQHSLHDRCRKVCKFCECDCLCRCHLTDREIP